MAVSIIWDEGDQVAAMYDTTTDTAFGPVFSGPSADTELQEFLAWLDVNPLTLHEFELARRATEWSHLPSVNTDG